MVEFTLRANARGTTAKLGQSYFNPPDVPSTTRLVESYENETEQCVSGGSGPVFACIASPHEESRNAAASAVDAGVAGWASILPRGAYT